MSLLDFVRAAVPGAVAARVGYRAGEQERTAADIAAAKLAKAEKRQSLLDQMKDQIDQANLAKTKAETDHLLHPAETHDYTEMGESGDTDHVDLYDRRSGRVEHTNVPRKAPEKKAPTSRNTADGIEEWDSATGTWKLTGRKPYVAPPRPLTPPKTPAERHLDRVERQVDDTRADIVAETNKLSEDPDPAVLKNLRTRGDSLKHVRDSLAAVVGTEPRSTGASAAATGLNLTAASDSVNTQRSAYDAAKAALVRQGKTSAQIEKTIGKRP